MSEMNHYSDLNEDQSLLLQFCQLHQFITEKREGERQKLAQKLNDEVIQTLLALQIQLSGQIDQPSEDLRAEFADSLSSIADLVEELKLLARELRPLEVDTLDLVDILEQECLMFSASTGIPVTFAAASLPELPERMALCFFRLVQAALNNIKEHAYATSVWVNLWITENTVVLKIEDNGQGLETVGEITELVDAPGLTLFDRMLRFQQLGGYMTLQSHPDEGTKVTAVLPLPLDV